MKKVQPTFQANMTNERTSALRKYQDTVVGNTGLGQLLKFELIMLFCSWVPGAFGFLLRKLFYPSLFGAIGHGVIFGRNVVIRHPHKMRIGSNVVIDDNCVLDAKGCQEGEFVISDRVIVSRGCILSAKYGTLSIGEGTNFGANCLVYAVKDIVIGSETLFAAQCYIGGSMYNFADPDIPPIRQGAYSNGVSVGDGCWLGADVKVIDGARIGDGVILGSGAVVTKAIEPYSVAVGVPAKVIKSRKITPFDTNSKECD